MKPGARRRDGDWACGIETEKPDAGLAALGDVSPHIQFREGGKPGNAGGATQAHSRHAKRDDAEPGAAFEMIELEC